ncbi:putative disease resistance RPP13-like protein 3 [Sesamum alatum]|uniref:Disease resistance RPP13-like protein 3 n=1 Tax=Sesamum alatum TaxID=300844 RepID=A0AAE1Y6I2_9LAMI|nr:putative disease resistance RPP13-like protein 3 [Sesamum alatum]
MFPEDFEIPVWKLLRMWIAEGFIQKMSNISLEETAEIYLQDLIDRNLLRVDRRRSDDECIRYFAEDRTEQVKAGAKFQNARVHFHHRVARKRCFERAQNLKEAGHSWGATSRAFLRR